MDDFERIFEAYGADYQVTLGRFMGNRKMYMKFLGMLFQDENLSKLGNALEQGDMTSAFEAAHTLKGVTGNMGLTPLYDAVCTIVEPLRTGEDREDYTKMYEDVCRQFKRAEKLRANLAEISE